MGDTRQDIWESEIKPLYTEVLASMLPLPDLYRENPEIWKLIVLSEFSPENAFFDLSASGAGQYMVDKSVEGRYRMWWGIYQSTPPMNKSLKYQIYHLTRLDRMDWEWNHLWSVRSVEEYMRDYGLDRHTACILKSLSENRLIIEPEWIKI